MRFEHTDTAPWPIASREREMTTFSGGSRRAVLVADDDPLVRRMTARLLHNAGFAVTMAQDGVDLLAQHQRAALERWPHEPFDVILSDVDMPRCDGFGALRNLRDRSIYTPVVFMTGRCDAATRARALELGAVDVLAKPFDPATLRAVMNAACARERAFDDAY
jgi:CheY-like chemotaxis protein